jgi:hypothetical protein
MAGFSGRPDFEGSMKMNGEGDDVERISIPIPLLPLSASMAGYRVNFTFTILWLKRSQ